MKKIEELGISPAPWQIITVNGRLHSVEASPRFIGGLISTPTVCSLRKVRRADARLIAAAPRMYKLLYEATVEYCHDCEAYIKGKCVSKKGSCFVQEWRAALAEAAGEGEVK